MPCSQLERLVEGDSRFRTLALLFLPVIGWVGFNIAGPAVGQLRRMQAGKEPSPPTGRGGKGGKRR
jgi:photosystem II PsbY protein